MYDVLEEISGLSLKQQDRKMILSKADKQMKRAIRQLAMFHEGTSREKNRNNNKCFRGPHI